MTNQHIVKRKVQTCECGNHCWVVLTRGYCALLDPVDAEFIGQWSWSAHVALNKRIAAVRRENSTNQLFYMHRAIAAPDSKMVVDHINGDPLDNRRANLRCCKQRDNSRNKKLSRVKTKTSRFKGVWTSENRKGWQASIRVNYKTVHLGRFATEELAALAYDSAAVEHFGEFAVTNAKLGLLP
jgi:hypothetical protein